MNRELALFAEIYPLLHKKRLPDVREPQYGTDTIILPQPVAYDYDDDNQLQLQYEEGAFIVQTL